jgi:hypothetical protein
MHKKLPLALAFAMAWPAFAGAQSSTDLQSLKQEIDALRSSYETRLRALEDRLKAAEAAAASAAPAAPAAAAATAAPTPAAPAAAAAPAPAAAAAAGAGSGANAFNPAVSLILSGLYTNTSQDPASYTISGFQLPGDAEIGPGTRGFSLAETELGLAASIDPWLQGAAHIALGSDNSVSVEEAYIQTTSLGAGFTLKAGRFFSNIGYLNPQHAHSWDFVDAPLAYQAMLGSQYGDDGVQLKWLAPTDLYVELGAELGRGRSFPGGDNSRNGAGMWSLAAHLGGDLGASHSWRAGLSVLEAKAASQSLLGADASGQPVESLFDGSTRVWVADAVWKWAPEGNATRTNFKLQGEYMRSTRSGVLTYDPTGSNSAGDYRAVQSGWYVQGLYQFMPRWRAGVRTERLDAGTPEYGANSGLYAAGGDNPRKTSLMLDFSASEFSRLRFQFSRDEARLGTPDNLFFLQYQMSLGAHGAHGF